jgi:hypothetical protein
MLTPVHELHPVSLGAAARRRRRRWATPLGLAHAR